MKRMLLAACLTLAVTPALAQTTTINLCGGGEGGVYDQVANTIAAFAKGTSVQIRVIKDTGGTWGNIERTMKGNPTPADYEAGNACHAMIGQPDGASALNRENSSLALKMKPILPLHREYLQVICSKKLDISDLTEIEGKKDRSVAIGNPGSGSWLIWQNFIAEDEDYANNPTTTDEDSIALSSVASGQSACMIVPAALGHKTVREADEFFGDEVVLAGADYKDFNDAKNPQGELLYEFKKIPSGTYKNKLQAGWFGGSSYDTVSWRAQLYANSDRVDQKTLKALITAASRARGTITSTFGE